MSEPAQNHLVRFTVDVVFPADQIPSQHRLDSLARALTENMHTVIVEEDDSANMKVEKYVHQHIHDATQSRCEDCQYHAYDDRNGDKVVEESQLMQ